MTYAFDVIKGHIRKGCGDQLEQWLQSQYRKSTIVSNVSPDYGKPAPQGKPDLVIQFYDGHYEVISVKYREDSSHWGGKAANLSIPIREYDDSPCPEMKHCSLLWLTQ